MKKNSVVLLFISLILLSMLVGVIGCAPSSKNPDPIIPAQLPPAQIPISADQYYKQGFDLSQSGQYNQAIEVLTKAIAIDHNNAPAYYTRGCDYISLKKWDLAIQDLEKAIEIKPTLDQDLKLAEAYVKQAIACNHNFKFTDGKIYSNKAIENCKKSIQLNPQSYMAYYRMACAYQTQSNPDSAISNVSKAIELNPKYSEAYCMRASASVEKSDIPATLSDINKAISLDPNNANIYGIRSMVYSQQKNDDLAIADLTKAIELDPHEATFYFNRSKAYINKAQSNTTTLNNEQLTLLITQALSDAVSAEHLDPNWSLVYTQESGYFILQQMYDKAIESANKSIELNPDYDYSYYYRGSAYNKKKQYDLALKDFNKVIEISKNNNLIQAVKKNISEMGK